MSKEELAAYEAERAKQRELNRLTRDVRTIFIGQLQQKVIVLLLFVHDRI